MSFPGWAYVDDKVNKSNQYSAPQEMLGINRQVVYENDYIERRRRYLVRWVSLKGERTRQWGDWKDLADYHMPEIGRWLTSDHNKPKDTSKILDSTPTRMSRALIAGLMALHTSPARPWSNVTLVDQDLAEWGPVRQALYELNRRMRLIWEFSGLYRTLTESIYPGLVNPGLGTCICEEDDKKILRFIPLALGTYAIASDGLGKIDTIQYEEAWSVGQLVKVFGWENVSRSAKVAWNGGWLDQYVSVLRTIMPNSEFIPGAIGKKGARWGSAYMEIGGLSSAAGALAQPSSDPVLGFLQETKYDENPVLCARWATTSRDDYPTGPGHDALPDSRQLMQLHRRKLLAISKGVNPALLVPDSLRMARLSALPGDAIYVPSGSEKVEIRPVQEVDHEWVEEIREEIRECQSRIGQSFFYELMLAVSGDGQSAGRERVTAAEIAAKQQEKMLQLGPVVENINEFLTNLCERTIAIMARKRMIPEFPKEARFSRFKVEFVSTLAQAQKLVGIQAKEKLIQFVSQVAQMRTALGQMAPAYAVDKINTDKIIDRYADEVGVTPDVMSTDDQVAQARQQREKEAQMQQQVAEMQQATEAAKNLGSVDLAGDNPVSRMLGQPAAAMSDGGAQ